MNHPKGHPADVRELTPICFSEESESSNVEEEREVD
jgi:hypothetical protein